MGYQLGILFFLFVGLPIRGWSQLARSTPLPYKACNPGMIFNVAETDSVRQRAILDSIAILFAGRWQLAEEGAGACFVPAHAPAQDTEMILTRQGKGVVYAGGKQVTTFQLLLSFYWGNARFVMNETGGKPYFDFFPPYKSKSKRRADPKFEGAYRNVLRVCEETLWMSGPRTGLSYVFRRLPARYGPEE